MFIYKTTHISGKYYIGRCSRSRGSNTYLGSGKWVKSIKDKSTLTREILSEHDTFEELCIAEELAIQKHINDPLCMNWNNKSVGFASGELNPSRKGMFNKKHTEETKRLISEQKKKLYSETNNHPMLGKSASELNKQRSSSANSCTYEITFEDGSKEIVSGLLKWCKERGYSDITFHRKHKEGKTYRGMTYVKLGAKYYYV